MTDRFPEPDLDPRWAEDEDDLVVDDDGLECCGHYLPTGECCSNPIPKGGRA